MIKKLLIANRGEIACRVMRTARRMQISTVAVYSDADANALHVKMADEAVHLGPAPAKDSYLRADLILKAAKDTGADAIHPGYGFLSENADFARACADAGVIFVGPSPESIEAMGLKDQAKKLMEAAGVPVTPGYHGEDQDPGVLAEQAGRIGYPVLIKAVAGGGGKGMRKVDAAADFAAALESCKREASSSFGDDRVLIEKFITSPRHIEVQVFGDSRGRVVHFFERDCSLQRRHQKVIEEAPAPGMTPSVRAAMCSAAVQAAKAVDYVGAGTIEFIVDGSGPLREDGFYFMEMNTRLQVEHPVTEEITGFDLVELQLRVASGGSVPEQNDIAINGWAMEARLYAEDPETGFLPSVGTLEISSIPGTDRRVDSGLGPNAEITIHYDPMIAKIITHGPTRDAARQKLIDVLHGPLEFYPVKTNGGFLSRALRHPVFAAGEVNTRFIDDNLEPLVPAQRPLGFDVLAAVALIGFEFSARHQHSQLHGNDPWNTVDGFRVNADPNIEVDLAYDDGRRAVTFRPSNSGGDWNHSGQFAATVSVSGADLDVPAEIKLTVRNKSDDGRIFGTFDGEAFVARASDKGDHALISFTGDTKRIDYFDPEVSPDSLAGGGAIKAPMPGKVLTLAVEVGDVVTKGQTLAVLEAMKMEHALTAPRDGVVDTVATKEGAQVGDGDVLVTLEELE